MVDCRACSLTYAGYREPGQTEESMWLGLGRTVWLVPIMLLVLAEVNAEGSGRRLAEAEAGGDAISPQHSLLLKMKSRLDDPLDSLASWVPEVGPCADGGDSFVDGWEFVKCDGSRATQL